jgi:hypothetical protein
VVAVEVTELLLLAVCAFLALLALLWLATREHEKDEALGLW